MANPVRPLLRFVAAAASCQYAWTLSLTSNLGRLHDGAVVLVDPDRIEMPRGFVLGGRWRGADDAALNSMTPLDEMVTVYRTLQVFRDWGCIV